MDRTTDVMACTLISAPVGTSVYVLPYHMAHFLEELSFALILENNKSQIQWEVQELLGAKMFRVWLESLVETVVTKNDIEQDVNAVNAFWKEAEWDRDNVKNKFHTVKAIMLVTGWGLKQARDWVEGLVCSCTLTPWAPLSEPDIEKTMVAVFNAVAQWGDWDEELRSYIPNYMGKQIINKIATIKAIREVSGLSLREAKDWVEDRAPRSF